MSPLATHLPLMPYIDLPAIATESTEKLQAFCDRLLELNFPFYAEKPYTASGCTADIAKHPWSLFRYIYDRQENTTSNDAAIAQAVFSENAERWVEWKSSHDTSCLQIWPDLSQFERYGAASTFSYMSDTRMCAVAEALGQDVALVTGVTHAGGFESYYPAGHAFEGNQVHLTHKFGKDIDISIPPSLQWKTGEAKPSEETIKQMAKACDELAAGDNVLQIIVGPLAYKEAIKTVDPTNSCGKKILYASGHSDHFHVELADSEIPPPPAEEEEEEEDDEEKTFMDWIIKLAELGYGRGTEAFPYRPLQIFEAVNNPDEPNPAKQSGHYAPKSLIEEMLFDDDAVEWQRVDNPFCAEVSKTRAWTTKVTHEYMTQKLNACKIRSVMKASTVNLEFSDQRGEAGANYQRNGRSVAFKVPCMKKSSSLNKKCSAQVTAIAKAMYDDRVEQILVPRKFVAVVRKNLTATSAQAGRSVASTTQDHVAIVLKAPNDGRRKQLLSAIPGFECDVAENQIFIAFAGITVKERQLANISCPSFFVGNSTKNESTSRHAVALSDSLFQREWELFHVENCIPVMFFCLRVYASGAVAVGVGWNWDIDIAARALSVGLVPFVRADLSIGGSVDLFLAKASLELTATIADITLPLTMVLKAPSFPIAVCMDGALEIRPLSIRISFIVAIRDSFEIGWFYIRWTWGTQWEFVLYEWSAPPIIIRLFTTCKGTPEVAEPRPGRIDVSQDSPYADSLDSDIACSKATAFGATESVTVGTITGSNGDYTQELIGKTGGRVEADFPGVDGETYQVGVKTCTTLTRDQHCTKSVVKTLIYDNIAPKVSVGWFGLELQSGTGHALVTYPKMLCFEMNYTDTSFLTEYTLDVVDSDNGSLIYHNEGVSYVNPCMRNLVVEANRVYNMTVAVADAVYHETTVVTSFIADLTPVVLKTMTVTCEGEPGLQWADDRLCVSAVVFSRPLTSVRYEWSAYTSGGMSFSGVMRENSTHVSVEQSLNETMTRGDEYTVVLYAIYGNRNVKFQAPMARIAVDPVVVVTANPCQHYNQDICFEVEKSSEISVVHGKIGDRAEVELGPSGCLPHSQTVPGEVAVLAWGCNTFGKCSPTSQLSVAMRDGIPQCSVARDTGFIITPNAVCFDFNVSSDSGCGLRRVTAFLELIGSRADVTDPDTSPAVSRSEENVGQRATMHCFSTPLQDLSVYRVGLVAVDANGEQTDCSVSAITDLSPPTPAILVKNQFQVPTGTLEFTMVPPPKVAGDPDTEASIALEVRLFSVSGWSSNDTFNWVKRIDVAYDSAPVPYVIGTDDRTGRFVITAVAQDRAGNALRVVKQIVVDSTPPTIGTVKIGSAAAHRSKLPTNTPLVVDFGLGECGQSLNVVEELVSVTGPHGVLLHRDSLVADVMDTCRGGTSIYCNGLLPFDNQADCVEMACSAGGTVLAAQTSSHSTETDAATVCRQGVGGLYTSSQALDPHCSPLYNEMPCRELAFQVAGFPITRTVGGCVKRVPLSEFFAGPQKACHTTTLGDRHPVLQSDTHVMNFAGSSFMVSSTDDGKSGIGINGLTLSDDGCRKSGTCHIEYPQSVKFFCIPDSLPRADESECGAAGDDESGMTCNVTLVDMGSGTVLEVLQSTNNEKSVTSGSTYDSETVVTAAVECLNGVGMHVRGISAHTLVLDPPPGRMESVGGSYLSTQGVTIDVSFEEVQAINVCIGAWDGDCMYAGKVQPVNGTAVFTGPFPVESFLFATAFVETTRGLSFEHSIDPMMIDLTPPDEGIFEVDCGCGDDCEYVTKNTLGELRCLLTWTGFDDVSVNVSVSLSGTVLASGMRAEGTLEFALQQDGNKFLVGLSDDNAAPAAGRKVENLVPYDVDTPLVFALEASNLAGVKTTAEVGKYPSGCHPEPEVALLGGGSRSGAVGNMSVLASNPTHGVCFEALYAHGRVCKVTVLFKDPKTGETLFTTEPDVAGEDKIEICGLEAVLPTDQPFSVQVVSARCSGCSATKQATLFLDSSAPEVVFAAGTVNTKEASFCVNSSVATDITLASMSVTATDVKSSLVADEQITTLFDAPVCVTLSEGVYNVCVSAVDAGGRTTKKCRSVQSDSNAPRVAAQVSLGCARKSGLVVPVNGVQQVWWEPTDWVCITEADFESFVQYDVSSQLIEADSGTIVATTKPGIADIQMELEPGTAYYVSVLAVDVFGRHASSTTEQFVSRPEDADVAAVALLPTQGETVIAGLPHWRSSLCVRSPEPPSVAEECVVVAWLALDIPVNIDAAFDDAVHKRSSQAFFSASPELCLSAADVVGVAGYDEVLPMEFFIRTQCWDRYKRAGGPSEGNVVLDRKVPTVAIRPMEAVSSVDGGVDVKYGAQDDYLSKVTVVIWQLDETSTVRMKVMGQASAENPVNSEDLSIFVSVDLPEERYLAVLTVADAAGNEIEVETAFWSVNPSTTTSVDVQSGDSTSGSAPPAVLRRSANVLSHRASVLSTFGAEETIQGVTYIAEQMRDFKVRLNDSLPISRVEMCLSTQDSACNLKDMAPVPWINGAYQYQAVVFEAGGDGRVFYVTLRYCLALCDTVDIGPFMFDTSPPIVSGQLTLQDFASTGQSVFVDWADHFADPDTELSYSVCLSADAVSPCFVELSTWSDNENLTISLADDLEGQPIAVCVLAQNRGNLTSRLCHSVYVTNEVPDVQLRYGTQNASSEGVLAQFGVTVSWNVASQVPLKSCRVQLSSTIGLANTNSSIVLPAQELANVGNVTSISNYEGGWVDVGTSSLWVFGFEPAEGEELVTRLCCTLENDRELCAEREAKAVVAKSWKDAYFMGAIDLTPPECTWDTLSQLTGISRGPNGGYFFNGTAIGLRASGCVDRESKVTYTFCMRAAGGSGNCTEAYQLENGQSATLTKHFADGERVSVEIAAAQPWGQSVAVHEHVVEQNLARPVIELASSIDNLIVGTVGTRDLCIPLRVYDANGVDTFSCSDELMLLTVCNQSHLCLNTSSPRSGAVELLAYDSFGFANSAVVEVVVEKEESKSKNTILVIVICVAGGLTLVCLGFIIWHLCARESVLEEVPKEVQQELDSKEYAGSDELQKHGQEPIDDVLFQAEDGQAPSDDVLVQAKDGHEPFDDVVVQAKDGQEPFDAMV
ncbi:hypothetical protein DIPPA_28783 [Diplonema papillatum]|nr:hypothetical protein DIPPA_28783 [Diplonema papillatum]